MNAPALRRLPGTRLRPAVALRTPAGRMSMSAWCRRRLPREVAAARDGHVDPEDDDRPDDRADDAGGLQEAALRVGAEDQESEESSDERADDAEDDRHEDAD